MTRTTERLILREYDGGDFAALREIDGDPEVQRGRGFEAASEEHSREVFERLLAAGAEPRRTRYQFAVTLRSDERLIGYCGLVKSGDEDGEAEIGYGINRRYWGRGHATESAWAVLRFGFEQLGLHRIFGVCPASNTGSARVMEKVGMRREGHFRESRWMLGRRQDILLYAILAPGRRAGRR